jgi:hypothetical protein
MYRDLVYRPGEDSYNTRDLVFRPGVDITAVETLPYRRGPGSGGGIVADRPTDYGISERPYTAEVPNLDNLVRSSEDATRKAQLLLELFMRGMDGNLVAALPEPMSQEEFQHEVTKRMDRNKPSVQDVLRNKFGVGSIREGINQGIFPAPPRLPGI